MECIQSQEMSRSVSESNSVICYKEAIKRDRWTSLEIVMRDSPGDSLKRRLLWQCRPIFTLTLEPAFCQAPVLGFLSIHVLTCVSVQDILPVRTLQNPDRRDMSSQLIPTWNVPFSSKRTGTAPACKRSGEGKVILSWRLMETKSRSHGRLFIYWNSLFEKLLKIYSCWTQFGKSATPSSEIMAL